ncbi:MAG: cupin domain-containing protein [Acidobacteria bacterium]|nr:cupin domain-containing protein [Acidobacteriota bacterium]
MSAAPLGSAMIDDMERRAFLAGALLALPSVAGARGGQVGGVVRVPAGEDRSGAPKGLGISTIDIKITTADAGGALLVIENTNRAKGGPARHLHTAQDEVFYVLEGEYVIEVGSERYALGRGDTLLAPRQVPHAWAYVGAGTGRLLISFTPAEHMEAFFREVAKTNAMPPRDPAIWKAHGMELVGPPLEV